MSTTPHILMCPPDYFGIEYEINAWMKKDRQVDHPLAVKQWTALQQVLIEAGAKISLLEAVKGLPDLVFTANAALIYRKTAILSRFMHKQRQGEEEHDQAWLEANGFKIHKLPETISFEGAGDALFCGDTLLAGYRMRSDIKGYQDIGTLLGCRVTPLELVNPYYYHIDTCFCPLSVDTAIYFPGAFDEYGRKALTNLVPNLIEVNEEEARSFACNAVVVNKTVATNSGCPDLHKKLKENGFCPVGTPLGEFVKSGGSAKCLTLRLDGEEGAGWKYKSGVDANTQA
ncbi:MAG: arginine deiminase-related protein [Pirellulaceae bacterium]|nr:arginine deiminase-related protein [Pirellulaceae bacterium]